MTQTHPSQEPHQIPRQPGAILARRQSIISLAVTVHSTSTVLFTTPLQRRVLVIRSSSVTTDLSRAEAEGPPPMLTIP